MNRFQVMTAVVSCAMFSPFIFGQNAGESPVNEMCPIGKEAIVASAGTVEYDGKTIGLCCPSCGKAFLAWDDERKDEFIRLAMAGDEPGRSILEAQRGAQSQPAANSSDEIKSEPYLLDTCPVSGQKLGSMGDPIVKTIEGREVKFCCGGCVGAFESDTEKHLAEIDKKMIEQQLPYYPMQTCAVMDGSKLGSMGDPVNYIYKNRLVRFCCAGCKPAFDADPKKYLDKLDKAVIAQQSERYPLETCAVMENSKLGSMGDPMKIVVANRLVQFCCAGCKPAFGKSPAQYIARIDKAWKESEQSPASTVNDESN